VTNATTPPESSRVAAIGSTDCRSSPGAVDRGDPKIGSLIHTLLHAMNADV
jgi:hypothetical protein